MTTWLANNFASREDRHKAGKALAQLLRQFAPGELMVDLYGYAPFNAVLYALALRGYELTEDHVVEIVKKDPQQRFELFLGKIRTKAGHRYPVEPASSPIIPPELLYHGTSPRAAKSILKTKILRMGKAYVHLSSTVERAFHVGSRKSKNPVLLSVKALEAYNEGLKFWRSGQVAPDGEIYLSEQIPHRFIEILPGQCALIELA